jgi:integrase
MTASNVRKLVTRSGEAAKLPFPIHPHMLRHACGYLDIISTTCRFKYMIFADRRLVRFPLRLAGAPNP